MTAEKKVPTIPFVLKLLAEAIPRMTRKNLTDIYWLIKNAMSDLDFETYSRRDRNYIDAAERYCDNDDLDVDTNSTVVSCGPGPDNDGAFVQAWVWVPKSYIKKLKKEQRDEQKAAKASGGRNPGL